MHRINCIAQGQAAAPALAGYVRACVDAWLRSPNSPTGVAGQWGRSPRLVRNLQPGQDLVVKYGFIQFADDTPTSPRSSSAPPGVWCHRLI